MVGSEELPESLVLSFVGHAGALVADGTGEPPVVSLQGDGYLAAFEGEFAGVAQ